MKTLMFLISAAAIAVGGAFFEMWSIPRFEDLPTVSDYATRSRMLENEAQFGSFQNAKPVQPKKEDHGPGRIIGSGFRSLSR